MGSITSRPKPPATPVAQTPIITPPTNPVTTPTEPNAEEIAKTRAENILRRSRSALGTVYTSFRGILSGNGANPQRKSLLGE